MPLPSQRIRLVASFTVDPILRPLRFLSEQTGLGFSCEVADYNQVFQEILDPLAEAAKNHEGVNVFFLRPEDLAARGDTKTVLDEWIAAFEAFQRRTRAAGSIVVFCPFPERSAETAEAELSAKERLSGISGVNVIGSDFSELDDSWFDEEANRVGHIPFTGVGFSAIATALTRSLCALRSAPSKVVVLDADGTLWGGICGEEKPEELRLDGGFAALRQKMRKLRGQGMLLCLCSKNHPADVEAVLSERGDDLFLERDDFVAWKANWESKSRNIRSIAEELNLGLDSFVFLDDNPVEIGEVAAGCPEVLSILLPEDPGEFASFLDHLWPLDLSSSTEMDVERTEFYRSESDRNVMRDASGSYRDFLEGLQLKVEIEPMGVDDVPRVAQLTQRTNQFNANGIRRTEAEIRAFVSHSRIGL